MPDVSQTRLRPAQGGVFVYAVAGVLLAVLYLPVLVSLVGQWLDDPNYRHGLLVPVISGYLIYQRRGQLRSARRGGGTLAGLLLIAAAAVLLVGGTAAGELFTTRLSLPTLLIGLSLFVRGVAWTRVIAFPLLLLYAMVPLPYIIYYKVAFPLQLMSARLSAAILDVLGVNLARRGNILMLPSYQLEIVTACSGLRSLMSMVTLGLVLGAVGELSPARRIVLVASAVPVAVLANTFRLVVTALGAYVVSAAFADGFLHGLSGMVVFATGLVLLLSIYWLLSRTRRKNG